MVSYNMGLSSSRNFRVCLILALVTLHRCDAFVPRQKIHNTFPFQSQVVKRVQYGTTYRIPERTRISMILEQFVAGRDEATRKKDTGQYLQQVQKRVDRINELEAIIEELSDDELQAKTAEFKARLAKGEDINGPILEEAFAVVREAAW